MMLRLVFPVLVAFAYVTGEPAASHKRAPSGFTGVRGKKSVEDTYHDQLQNNIIDTSPLQEPDQRTPQLEYIGNKLYAERNDLLNDLPKRAPSGFLGMRGKKEYEIVDEFDKRAPSMGFLGMRGKKESDNFIDDEQTFDKRAPSGFMGMRGKKEYIPYEDIAKRVAGNGFFGMRGKKQPARSSFFGMRGKKYPYEFRGKFVGVRGKKGDMDNGIYGNNLMENNIGYAGYGYTNDLDLNQLIYLLAQGGNGNDFNFEKRKGPSGFLGMRG